jgi:hypothetical protein
MSVSGSELTDELIEAMPLEPPPLDPPIGKCKQCKCQNYAPGA